jgi:hypothetical protein
VKIHFSITLDIAKWYFREIFGVHFCFNMLCHANNIMLKVKFT